jgi:hypothetical protein
MATGNTPHQLERLDKRVQMLEQQVAQLRAMVQQPASGKNWRRTVGMFTGDEVMKRIDEGARMYRQADRAKARRPARRPRATQP